MKKILIIISLFFTLIFTACGGGSSGGGSSAVQMEINKVYTVHTGDTLEKKSPDATITVRRTQENQNTLTTVVLNSGKAVLTLH